MASNANDDPMKIKFISESNRDKPRVMCCDFIYYLKAGDLFVCKCKKDDGKQCYSSITLNKERDKVIKVCGKKDQCDPYSIITSHGHEPTKPIDILAIEF